MAMGSSLRRTLALLLLSCSLLLPAWTMAADVAAARVAPEGAMEDTSAPVVVDGSMLFRVRGVTSFPADKRAQVIADRIVELAADPKFRREDLRLEPESSVTLLMGGTRLVMGIYDADARLEGIDRHILAQAALLKVGDAIDAWRLDRAPATLQRSALFAVGATFLLALALWSGRWLYRRLRRAIEAHLRQRIHDVKLREFRLVGAEQLWSLLSGILGLSWTVAVLAAIYVYLGTVLALFPWTRGLAGSLTALVVDPLRTLGLGFLEAVPKLVFLAILYLITRYLLKLVRLFFAGIAEGRVIMPEFEAEWAWPTYRLVRLLLVAFALIVAYPYIPGSGTEAFKGVSIFIGIIFSLGSSSLIGNLIAGYTMTYRRAFKIGDRVRIGEHMGDVEHVRMLVTHLRTPKNEEVVIPNSMILNGDVVNYSTLARQQGLILHTTVGISYETPWRQVEAMLLEAAARTPGLLKEPPPFVRQKTLGDFCVTYEINVFCANPQAMGQSYTDLHRNILDLFNEYRVQIMTPAYEGDPEQPKVVPREQWYAAPARPPESSAST